MNTLRKFITYYSPYKTVFFIDLLCAAFISIVDLAYPQILRVLTNTLFTKDSSLILHALPFIAAGLLFMYLIQSLCKYYVSYQGHMMGACMERDMRRQLFDHYEKLSFSYYSKNNSGQMMSKLVSDLFDIAEFAHHGPENLFISVVKIIGSFIFLFLINARLALPLAIIVLCMFVFSIRQNKKMQETFMDNRRKIGDVNASLQDTLAGIRVVQSFTNEEIERKKFQKSNHAFLLSKKENYHCIGSFMGWNLLFQGLMYSVTLIYGGYLIAKGFMNVGDLAMYALYIGIFISPIQILVELIEMIQKGLAGFRRFLDVVETEPEIKDASDAEELTDVKGLVRYENVSFHYADDDTSVLSHISFEIPAGRSVALVGPSGSGKTTICSLLPRFYDVTDGTIRVDGQDIRKIKLSDLRNHIGIVQQDVYLFAGTILENIRYGKPEASREDVIKAAKEANAHEFIMSFPDGYDTIVGERGVTLSGGQRQRVAIARMLIAKAPIMIFDDSLSAVDADTDVRIRRALRSKMKEATVILISHRITTLMEANQILVLNHGVIEECGTHQQLIHHGGIYQKIYEIQLNQDDRRLLNEGGDSDAE